MIQGSGSRSASADGGAKNGRWGLAVVATADGSWSSRWLRVDGVRCPPVRRRFPSSLAVVCERIHGLIDRRLAQVEDHDLVAEQFESEQTPVAGESVVGPGALLLVQ